MRVIILVTKFKIPNDIIIADKAKNQIESEQRGGLLCQT